MRTRSKLLLTAALATALVAAAVTAASANQLSVSQTTFRIVWTSLEFTNVNTGTIRCPVTVEGSFHSATFSKTVGALIGYVNRATTALCAGGEITFNQEALPWHVRYRSFTGTLPRITSMGIGIVGAKFTLDWSGFICTTISTAEHPWTFIANISSISGTITGMRADETVGIPLRGSFLCEIGGEYSLSGTGAVTQQGSSTSISVTLITGPIVEPSLSPSPVEFARVATGSLSERAVTITAGSESLRVNSIRVALGNFFAITDPNRCVGATLAARTTCSFTAIFAAPREAERRVEDTITVETTIRSLRDTVRGST